MFTSDFFDSRKALSKHNYDDLLMEIDEDKRKQLQRLLLSMYKDVLNVCNKHSLLPFLVGGSALGAVRHSGFIPWDDDLDIGMTRAHYNRFIQIFEQELSDRYILNAPNISKRPKARFAKILKKDTVLREVTDAEFSENGVYLDIFIIENVPINRMQRYLRGGMCNFLQFISSRVYTYENRNPILKEMYARRNIMNYKTRIITGKIFSFRKSFKWFESVDKWAQYKKTGLYGIVTGRKHYFGEIFEGKVIFPPQYIQFCDIKAPIFHDWDVYLSNLYGKYEEIPSEENRERHYILEMKM